MEKNIKSLDSTAVKPKKMESVYPRADNAGPDWIFFNNLYGLEGLHPFEKK